MSKDIPFTRLYLIRHGQVQGHETINFRGSTNVALTPHGRAQMEAAARMLEDVRLDAVYSSDLQRAYYGGRVLARSQELEHRVDTGFREIDFGEWESLAFDEIRERWPDFREAWYADIANYKPHGGESVSDLNARVAPSLNNLLHEHRHRTIALVAHSMVNRVILLQALGCPLDRVWSFDQAYGCLNIIDYFDNRFAILRQLNRPNPADAQPPEPS